MGEPPATGAAYTLKMPLLLLWNRIDFSSGEKELPPTRTVSMNCSMVYCFIAGTTLGLEVGEADWAESGRALNIQSINTKLARIVFVIAWLDRRNSRRFSPLSNARE